MMVSWRDAQSYSIADCMDAIGPEYRTKFDNDERLDSAEKSAFLMAVGLVGEQPTSYTVDGFRNLLEQYGPLWVTTDEDPTAAFAIHARIATGIYGDGTGDNTFIRIVDPAGGLCYDEPYQDFVSKYEEEAVTAGPPFRIQMVHFPGGIGPG
jgi:hypothetical protein